MELPRGFSSIRLFPIFSDFFVTIIATKTCTKLFIQYLNFSLTVSLGFRKILKIHACNSHDVFCFSYLLWLLLSWDFVSWNIIWNKIADLWLQTSCWDLHQKSKPKAIYENSNIAALIFWNNHEKCKMHDCLIQYNCLYILFPFVGNFLVNVPDSKSQPRRDWWRIRKLYSHKK